MLRFGARASALAALGLCLAGCGDGSDVEKKGRELGAAIGERASEVSEAALAQVSAMVEPYRADARALLNQAGGGAQSAIDSLSAKPREKEAMERQALRFTARHLPLLRAVAHYGDARRSYAEALALPDGDDKRSRIESARRQCLVACLEAGLDLTVLGTAGLVDQAAHHATHVLKALQIAQLASTKTSQGWLRPLDDFLDAGLAIPSVALTMDVMLVTDLSTLGDIAIE